MELHILNDPELCFKDIMKRHLNGEPLLDAKAVEEYEKQAKAVVEDKTDKEAKVNGKVVVIEPTKEVVDKEVKNGEANEEGESKKDKEKVRESARGGWEWKCI